VGLIAYLLPDDVKNSYIAFSNNSNHDQAFSQQPPLPGITSTPSDPMRQSKELLDQYFSHIHSANLFNELFPTHTLRLCSRTINRTHNYAAAGNAQQGLSDFYLFW
jgi:hypothetical protein